MKIAFLASFVIVGVALAACGDNKPAQDGDRDVDARSGDDRDDDVDRHFAGPDVHDAVTN
jgi:hypothetical protein